MDDTELQEAWELITKVTDMVQADGPTRRSIDRALDTVGIRLGELMAMKLAATEPTLVVREEKAAK